MNVAPLALLLGSLVMAVAVAAGQFPESASVVPGEKRIVRFTTADTRMGSDVTTALQTALTTAALNSETLEIPAAREPYNVGPIFFPNNSDVLIGANVLIQAKPGFLPGQKLLNIINVSNVRIRGSGARSTFKMLKSEYTSGEYRHCLNIEGATSVFISGISCNDSGGDGVYIGGGKQGYSSNIRIEDSIFDNNRRQGLSIVSGRDVSIKRCRFSNSNGTAPSDGIDIEPNGPSDQLNAITIEDSSTFGNAGNGLAIDVKNLDRSSAKVSVIVLHHNSALNGESGYFLTNQKNGKPGALGDIVIERSTSTLDGQYGAVASFYETTGPSVSFRSLTVVNSNRLRSTYDNSAIAVKRGGGGVGTIGNVSFVNAAIIDTTATIDTYFTFRDYSNIGFSLVKFVNPAELKGASRATGLFDGCPVLAVNVP